MQIQATPITDLVASECIFGSAALMVGTIPVMEEINGGQLAFGSYFDVGGFSWKGVKGGEGEGQRAGSIHRDHQYLYIFRSHRKDVS